MFGIPLGKAKKKILKIQNPNFVFGKKKKIWFAKKKIVFQNVILTKSKVRKWVPKWTYYVIL